MSSSYICNNYSGLDLMIPFHSCNTLYKRSWKGRKIFWSRIKVSKQCFKQMKWFLWVLPADRKSYNFTSRIYPCPRQDHPSLGQICKGTDRAKGCHYKGVHVTEVRIISLPARGRHCKNPARDWEMAISFFNSPSLKMSLLLQLQ